MLKASIRIDIGKWHDEIRAGYDPVQTTLYTLSESLGNPSGMAQLDWAAGVIDFGGSRILPFIPGQVPSFGTLFIQCLLTVVETGQP